MLFKVLIWGPIKKLCLLFFYEPPYCGVSRAIVVLSLCTFKLPLSFLALFYFLLGGGCTFPPEYAP